MERLYIDKQECNLVKCAEKLKTNYMEEWKKIVEKKSKLRTYKEIKNDFGLEKYAELDLTRSQCSVLAQIRCGILPIQIEVGRFTRIKLEDRLCPICKNGDIETETHFLFKCEEYKTERELFLRETGLDYNRDHHLLLKDLFNLMPRKFAKFCCAIYEKRKNFIFE